jgi:inner membrane protein
MKWFNHGLIACSTAALIDPAAVPAAAAGATAPDWLEWVAHAVGVKVKHRTITHYVAVWAVLAVFFLGVWDFHGFGAGFALGGLSHVLADALTVTGVPLGPWSDRRFHLFGGRLRTGDPAEYVIAGGFVVLAAALFMALGFAGWYPFFYDWGGLYGDGLLDGSEWRANRFRLL